MTEPVPFSSGCILLVTATLDAGGAERQLVAMANHWANRSKSVALVSWHDGVPAPDFYATHPGVRRVRFRLVNCGGFFGGVRRSVQIVRALRDLLIRMRPDCVISFIAENNILTLMASLGLGLRVIVSERAHPAYDTTVSPRFRWLRRWLYPHAARVVVQTQATDLWMREQGYRNSVVIPNVLHSFDPAEGDPELLVLAVGRLTRQKGFDLLLQAFARLRPQFAGWRLAILGEGPERSVLMREAEDLGIFDVVSMPGVDRNIAGWMSRAALVVQPSRFEGFPNAVLEAMALGKAVISADCPAGPAELIQDGVNGRLVAVEDVGALASAMHELMAAPDVRAALGGEARKVRQQFNEDHVMPLWESLLRDPRAINSK